MFLSNKKQLYMNNTDCPFCSPAYDLVCKDFAYCRLILNQQQTSTPSFLVIPKRHVTTLKELTPEELEEFIRVWHTSYVELMKKFCSNTGNMLLNEGAAAGQTVPHLHAHIFIRECEKPGEVVNMVRPLRKPISRQQITDLKDIIGA